MLRFLKRLFGIIDEKKSVELLVKNMHQSDHATDDSLPSYKKIATSKNRYFYIFREDIAKTEEDKKGLITNILLKPGKIFEELKYENADVKEQKRGIAKVLIDVLLEFEEDENYHIKLSKIKNADKPISILSIDKYNNCSLLGEHNGLKIIDLDKNRVIFEGEENDAFFKVDYNVVKNLLSI